MTDKKRGHGETGRSPLLPIIVLVYVAFFATAALSILVFFPETSLPREVRLRAPNLSGIRARLMGSRGAATAPETALPPAGRPGPAPAAAPAAPRFRLRDALANVRIPNPFRNVSLSRITESLKSIRFPDLGAALRGRRTVEADDGSAATAGQIRDLRSRLEAATTEINEVAASLSALVEASDLPDAEKRRRLDGIEERALAARKECIQEYEQKLGEKDRQIAVLRAELSDTGDGPAAAVAAEDLRRQLAQAETRHATEVARLKQAQAERERQLRTRHAQELKVVTDRYNPSFPELADILDKPAEQIPAARSAPYRKLLSEEGVLLPEQYEALAARAKELDALTDRLLQVPYSGSVPGALEHIRSAGRALSRDYGRLWSDLADRVAEKEAQSQATRSRVVAAETETRRVFDAVDRLARDARENGYVLDPYDTQNVLLQVSKLHSPRVGDLVYVFRKENELIGTLMIISAGETTRARLLQLTRDDRPIRPFDKILLTAEANG